MKDKVATKRWDWTLWLILGLTMVATLLGYLRNRLRPARQMQKSLPFDLKLDLQQFQGLSEAEARERRSPLLARKRERDARQVRREIWRSRTFSIFNLSLLTLAAVRALLGDPLGAWLTLGILILNVGLNVIQQMMATKRLEQLIVQTKPLATAIRDGQIRSIEVDEIVNDDLLVIGPGDEFMAGGEILEGKAEVAKVTAVSRGNNDVAVKEKGNIIQAGTYCIQGRAVYRVTNIPEDLGTQKWTPVQKKSELTPLQRIISRILRLMLVFIAVFLTLLLLAWFNSPFLSRAFEAKYREAVSIIFSISASGLFFMIVASYALGSARLGGIGVLVRESRAVESLAQVSVLCVSKAAALTSSQAHLDMFPSVNGFPILAERRVRQILGDLAHSATGDNFFLQSLSDNFSGSKRALEQAAWFLSVYGWSAVTFSETDVPGTYVIGEPAILQPHLVAVHVPEEESSSLEETESVNGNLRQRFEIRRFGRFFRRNDPNKEEVADDAVSDMGSPMDVEADHIQTDRAESGPTTEPDGDIIVEPVKDRGSIIQGLRYSLGRFRQTTQDHETDKAQEPEPSPALPQLLFAYTPVPKALYDVDSRPQLPMDLIPLCTLSFEERIQPQAIEVARTFTDAGVEIKILSSEDPNRMSDAVERLGLTSSETSSQVVISGLQLAEMNESQFEQTIKRATILGQLSSEQKGRIVRTLCQHEQRVAMVGDRVDDVQAMEAANLSISLRSSSQAALSTADIVLLENSLEVLPTMLQQGQRIVNGLLDILKINLTQIGYILLLILVMALSGKRIFYYHPTQGGVISFITVVIPSVGLTLWSSAQALPVRFMRSRLAHFVVPAAITMAAATLVINEIIGSLDLNTPVSQLAVTHGLIGIGLLLIIFVQPPTRFWVGGDVLSGSRRIIHMAIVLFLVFIAATIFPLTQSLLRLAPLEDVTDYLVLGAISLFWIFIVRAIWRAPWLRRRAGILSDSLDRVGDLSHR